MFARRTGRWLPVVPLLIVACLVAIFAHQIGVTRVQAQGQTPLPGRPTITPTIAPTRVPSNRGSSATPVPAGRITGTVIDQTTGAPAPGISVQVGDVTVTTDANGNYERSGLAAGSYQVALVLKAEQGVASQAPATVALEADATVVLHLAFRSPLAAPTAAAPTPTAPTPTSLPTTGEAASSAWLWMAAGLALVAAGLAGRFFWRQA